VNGFGVADFVTVSCGCSRVVVAVPVLFALFGSVVPAGGFAVALFVIDVPLVGALPVIVNVTLPPLGNVVIVLVTLLPATFTVPHAAPPVGVPQLAATAVIPAGTASLNVVPFALLGPRLLTTTVYVSAPPKPALAVPVLTERMSALGVTVFVTVPVHRAAAGQVGSPPPLAAALLFPFVAVAPTLTFNVSPVFAPAAIVPVNVQLSVVVPVQLQFVPVALANVMPVGSVSATVMFPAVGPAPVFDTVIV